MLVSDFNYHLPEDLIAQTPPAIRGSSRMLVMDRRTGTHTDDLFTNLPNHLREGDLLILNDSRVLPARLYATRARSRHTQSSSPDPTGRIEVLLTQQTGPHTWSALVRPARKIQPGERLHFHAEGVSQPILEAEVLTAGDFGERTLRFSPTPQFHQIVDRIGHVPLPPYIHRNKLDPDTVEDRARYQTVYAQPADVHPPGSAAAPTAGLHFTPAILAELRKKGVQIETLTLHVGLGTFQPVRAERTEDIRLHAEHYTLPPATAHAINAALVAKRRIIAAGTTTTRTLEHCALEAERARSPEAAPTRDLQARKPDPTLELQPHSGSTSIFLSPGHRFRIVSGLLTNFHLPQSTLLMLVSAFAGREAVLAAYAHAAAHSYRFFSYGDCMLIL